MFSSQHLEFFEKSCKHYSTILNDAIETLVSKKGNHYRQILELGVGTGGLTQLLMASLEFEKYNALDIAPELLTIASNKLVNTNNINFISSDSVEFLDSTKQEFDLIVSSFLVHNLPFGYKTKLFKKIAEKLKNGGAFLIIDKISQNDSTDFSSLNRQIGEFFEYQNGLSLEDHFSLEFWVTHYIEDESDDKRYSEKDVISFSVESGLVPLHKGTRYNMDTYFLFTKS